MKDILKSKKFYGVLLSIVMVIVGAYLPEKADAIKTILYIIAGWAGLHTATDIAYGLRKRG